MIQSVSEFEDASAFERSALATVFPLVHHERGVGGVDLRCTPLTNYIGATPAAATFDSGSRSELIRELRPLLFGAAWKVLDLLFEVAIWQTATEKPKKMTIAYKQNQAQGSRLLPLSADLDVWNRLAAVYVNTVEARHCLVHRCFVFDHLSNITHLRDEKKQAPLPDITVAEQQAFCRLAQCAAASVLRRHFTSRDRLVTIDALDALSPQHGLGNLGGGAHTRVPETIYVNAVPTRGCWGVNTRKALEEAHRAYAGQRYFDVEIHFPSSGLPPLRGRLEEAPSQEELLIDPVNPPCWTDP